MGQPKSKQFSSWTVCNFKPSTECVFGNRVVPAAIEYFTRNPPSCVCDLWKTKPRNGTGKSLLHSIPFQMIRALPVEWQEKFSRLYTEKYALLWKMHDGMCSYSCREPLDFESDMKCAFICLLSDNQWAELLALQESMKKSKIDYAQQHLERFS